MNKDTKKPLLSVVMPVYNSASFLQESIESIISQDFIDFEFIIIDDKSTDNSISLIEKYEKIDSRIVFLKNEKNMWIWATRNIWIKKSKTDFIVNFDSDDVASLDLLSKLYNTIKSKKVDIVGVNLFFIDKNSSKIWKKYSFPEYDKDIKHSLSLVCSMSNTWVIIRKKCFLDTCFYNEKDRYAEDYNIWLKFSEKWYLFYNIPEFLVYYRLHWNNSIIKESKWILKETLSDFKNKFKSLFPLDKTLIFFIIWTTFSYLYVFFIIRRKDFIKYHKNKNTN